MTRSIIDLTARLDQIEQRLPPLPAKSFAFGRATVRRTNDVTASVVSSVARRVGRVFDTAKIGVDTTSGQARSAAARTARTAQHTAKQSAGQARSAAERAASTAASAAKETIGQARSGAERTGAAASAAVKEVSGQARHQAGRTADVARDEAEQLLDDATVAVDPNHPGRGVPYEDWTKSQLYDRAQDLDIDGRSSMSKAELITALRSA